MIKFGECSGKSWAVPSLVSLLYKSNKLRGYSPLSSASHRSGHCPCSQIGCVFQRCSCLLFVWSFPSLHTVSGAQMEIMGILVTCVRQPSPPFPLYLSSIPHKPPLVCTIWCLSSVSHMEIYVFHVWLSQGHFPKTLLRSEPQSRFFPILRQHKKQI